MLIAVIVASGRRRVVAQFENAHRSLLGNGILEDRRTMAGTDGKQSQATR